MGLRAVVVGAGIAGLAAAKALADRGYRVRVLERKSSLRCEGVGLTLWPNAVRALEEVGLGGALADHAQELRERASLRPGGETIRKAPIERIAARFGPLLSVHQGELVAAMQDHADVAVELGADVAWAGGELTADGVPLEADLIVGADGIGSAVRQVVAPGVEARGSGQCAWRGIAPVALNSPVDASETLGRGRRFGLVRLSGERTYWFAVLPDRDAGTDLEQAFAGWHEPIPAVLAATPPAARSFVELADLPSLPRWHKGNVVLIGDAAHAMTPNLGQGAAQALIDVVALHRELLGWPQADALELYERTRKRRAERIACRSRTMGRIAQTSTPLLSVLRDTIARHAPRPLVACQMERALR